VPLTRQTNVRNRSLWYPGPLGGAKEANAFTTFVDPELNFPLGCCDADGSPSLSSPGACRGHLDIFDREVAQIVWGPGEAAYFQLSDHAYSPGALGSTHHGGSCQVGFSVDRGETWKVAASFIGNCPRREGNGSPAQQTFDFKVPLGIPEGDALFVWVWLNREHESFVNCAKVRIGSTTEGQTLPSQPDKMADILNQRPRRTGIGIGLRDHHRISGKSMQSLDHDRVDTCIWPSAPYMETSYFTVDAQCMPSAKTNDPESDTFEIGWDVPCGVVEGDGEYPIHMVNCEPYN
jgi:hypothetical protein